MESYVYLSNHDTFNRKQGSTIIHHDALFVEGIPRRIFCENRLE